MWLVFALISAIFDTLIDLISTKGLKNANFLPYTISWGITFFGSLFLIPFVVWLGLPTIDNSIFWLCLLVGGIVNVIAYKCYYTALQNADLSLIAPLTCLTPVFLLFISPLFFLISYQNISTEIPSLGGIIGVILIFIGSYILNLESLDQNYLEPLKSIWINPNLRKTVLAAFLWSVSMSLSKVALNSITGENDFQKTMFWGCLLLFTIGIFFLPFVIKEIKNASNFPKPQEWLILICIGLINAGVMFSQMVALSLTVTAYAIAVKRISNIFKVIFGNLLFKEAHFQERILACLIMVIGVICLTISNLIPNFSPLFWYNVFY